MLQAHQSRDVGHLLANLPRELQLLVMNFAFLMQMQAAYATDDVGEIARRVCEHGQDLEQMHCWLVTLLDLGVRIPYPPERFYQRYSAQTVFHVAARAGDRQLIQRLVRLGYNPNALDSRGLTAVHDVVLSVGFNRPERAQQDSDHLIIQTLCEAVANVKPSPAPRRTCIVHDLLDCSRGPRDVVARMQALKVLLKHGAHLSLALHTVAKDSANLPFVRILLDAGADIEERWSTMTPLAMAAWMKNPDVVQALLDAGANADGGTISVEDRPEPLPLFGASRPAHAPGTAKILRMLSKGGADMTRLNIEKHSILSFALTRYGTIVALSGCPDWDTVPDLIKALCEGGADVNLRHHGIKENEVRAGDIPLHIATRARTGTLCSLDAALMRSECIRILIAHGADVDSRNDFGRTPLHAAVLRGELFCAVVLLQHGADVDLGDVFGRTPLHGVVKSGHTPCAELLLHHGANVNSQNDAGRTPLHAAVLKGELSCAVVLLQHGADVNSRDNAGRTPLRAALERGKLSCANLLSQHSAGKHLFTQSFQR